MFILVRQLIAGKKLSDDYSVGWLGLARVFGWFLLFLMVFSVFLKSEVQIAQVRGLSDPRIYPMMAEGSEWIRDDPQQLGDVPGRNIAWVAGSGSQIVSRKGELDYLPVRVSNELDDADTNIWFYMIFGARSLDTYTAQLDAVDRKPDLIVIEINPAWAFSQLQIYRDKGVINSGIKLWPLIDDWRLHLSFSGFGDMLWHYVGSNVPKLSPVFTRGVTRYVSRALGRPAITAGKDVARNKIEGGALAEGQNFWLNRQVTDEMLAAYEKADKASVAGYQAAIMVLSNPDTSTWGGYLLERQFQIAAESDIPTLFYLTPVALQEDLHPDIVQAYKRANNKLDELRQVYGSKTIQVVNNYPRDVNDSLVQLDYSHLTDAGLFPEYLASQINALLEKDQSNGR
ncbi:MAG: hypothetical protein P8R04_07255 [Gammaproteobacteria bacterium]|nr:hypothetical protein [Gammaproteobacteria bacterium]